MSNENTALVTTESFNAVEVRKNSEMSAIAMSAKVKANIEAMCIMSERHPRNMLDVRARLLQECERPGFANGAQYRIPRKKWDQDRHEYVQTHIVGFSIRFAEAVLRYMRNIEATNEVVYDDDEKTIVTVTVRDYEMNTAVSETITVMKRTEKKSIRKGETPIGTRMNSYGDRVYIMPASDDEVAMKKGQLVSKSIRTLVLRLLPGDIKEECEDRVDATRADQFATDPMKDIKKIVDAFAKIRVMPDQLSDYLGHSLDALSLSELTELRGVYQAIADGEVAWADVLDVRLSGRTPTDDGEITMTPRQTAVAEALERTKRRQAEQAAAKAAAKAKASPATQQAAPIAQPSEADRGDDPDAY